MADADQAQLNYQEQVVKWIEDATPDVEQVGLLVAEESPIRVQQRAIMGSLVPR